MKPDFEPPKLSPWPFIFSDIVLLGVAAWIGSQSASPLQGPAVWAVAGLCGLGAVSLSIPFLVNYTRRQDLALAERQKEIAALAETTASSSEQIGVAVAGLNTVIDAANRATRHAEQLPPRLQEKINDFKEQLNEVAVTENEALAQELATLRAGETDRLEAHTDRIQKLVTELRQLEERLATARAESVASIEAASRSFAAERTASSKALAEAIDTAVAEALVRIRMEIGAVRLTLAPAPIHAAPVPAAPPSAPLQTAPVVAAPPSAPLQAVTVVETPTKATPPSAPPVETPPSSSSDVAEEDGPDFDEAVNRSEKMNTEAPRRRVRRREDENQGGLDLGDLDQAPSDEPVVSLSADGATRVVVTAYIGIGNKLFARGQGAGLSPERGVPLQFVSIGKWRWEAGEATEPVTLQLFKNDQQPALNVGTLTLEPGQQVEVKASF
ncbi:hypothetical protein [Nibricoccus sp. IMCC34717]|uniref:hypothetical protein n=1 Tax=Nibricoccus sp. IMCC34717 TaxID=3034021 RepID=UPI00384CA56D